MDGRTRTADTCRFSSLSQRRQVHSRAANAGASPPPRALFQELDGSLTIASQPYANSVRRSGGPNPAAPAAPEPDVKLRGAALAAAIFNPGKTPPSRASHRSHRVPRTFGDKSSAVNRRGSVGERKKKKKHTKDPTVHDNGSAQRRPM